MGCNPLAILYLKIFTSQFKMVANLIPQWVCRSQLLILRLRKYHGRGLEMGRWRGRLWNGVCWVLHGHWAPELTTALTARTQSVQSTVQHG